MITIRKPVFTTLVLGCILCTIFFMTGSHLGLGDQVPIMGGTQRAPVTENLNLDSLVKDDLQEVLDNTVNKDAVGGLGDDFAETPFMPKMANETLKAELGNAGWRLLHTILARYPEKPTKQEQSTLKQYIYLFAKVYPCGDCARHFQQLLQKFPPQVGSRKLAAVWGCHVHNQVNKRLNKPDYDCGNILEEYDCGCGADEQEADETLGGESKAHLNQMKVEKEGRQQG